MNGRPGASGPSRTLTEFTRARYVRIRMRRLRLLPEDERVLNSNSLYPYASSSDGTMLRRYFYSFRDITIGGQCPCNGHANECLVQHDSMVIFYTSCLFDLSGTINHGKMELLMQPFYIFDITLGV